MIQTTTGDWPLNGQKPWWQIKYDMENRPDWGHYVCSQDNMFDVNGDWAIHCWTIFTIPHKEISLEELYELTKWCEENIDNIWEGPIGYMGFWKFRFTTEEDRLAFKLRI